MERDEYGQSILHAYMKVSKIIKYYIKKKTKFKQYLSTDTTLQRILEGKLQHKEGTYTKEKTRN